jgi:hypothetical protein
VCLWGSSAGGAFDRRPAPGHAAGCPCIDNLKSPLSSRISKETVRNRSWLAVVDSLCSLLHVIARVSCGF